MNSTVKVANLVAQRSSLSSNAILKFYLSQQKRFTKSLLLKELWRLIQSGCDHKLKSLQSVILAYSYVACLHARVSNDFLQIAKSPNTAIASSPPKNTMETFTAGPQISNSNWLNIRDRGVLLGIKNYNPQTSPVTVWPRNYSSGGGWLPQVLQIIKIVIQNLVIHRLILWNCHGNFVLGPIYLEKCSPLKLQFF